MIRLCYQLGRPAFSLQAPIAVPVSARPSRDGKRYRYADITDIQEERIDCFHRETV
jgi:hypothetical protein